MAVTLYIPTNVPNILRDMPKDQVLSDCGDLGGKVQDIGCDGLDCTECVFSNLKTYGELPNDAVVKLYSKQEK